jgi:DNA-binding transcriptional regulator YiaG
MRYTDVPTDLYRLFDDSNQLLYVGTSNAGPNRWKQEMEKGWWPQVTWAKVEHFATCTEALRAETVAIRTEKPLYNIVGSSISRPWPLLSGDKIRTARKRAGLTQPAVACSLGIKKATVGTWERGKAQTYRFRAERLAECLGTTVEALWA